MIKSIFYKELLKIRWPLLTLIGLNIALMAYIYVDARHLFAMDHAEIVWYRVMHLGQVHYEILKYAPLLTGTLLGCMQYLPEMVGERLRLSLHLPVSTHRLILAHVLVGLTAVGLTVGLDLIALALITARYFPMEAVTTAFWTALPWCLAGLAAYMGVTLGLLDPGFKHKIFNMVIAAGAAGLFLYPAEPGGYNHALIILWAPLLLMIPAVLLPAYRFRFRRAT